ncbi:MAG TPA: hypothetical protein VGI81_02955 [Tepidisphaeraceae bacterium]|jgi:hypothetical protein
MNSQSGGGKARRLSIGGRAFIAAALIVVFTHIRATPAAAAKLPYDLDCLVFLADHIMEGRIVELQVGGPLGVRVNLVHSGSLETGQTINPDNLFSHLTPGTGCWVRQREPLKAGDRVVLFLRGRPGKLACVNEGMFLLVRGRACRFGVEPTMGMMGWQPPRLSRDSPTAHELAAAIESRLPEAAQLHRIINAPLSPKSIESLLSLLRQRAKPWPNFFADAISDGVMTRLADLGDAEIADRALAASAGRSSFFLRQVFQTPRGRDFLLDRLSDPIVETQHRLMLAWMLRDAGAVYASSDIRAATRPWPPGTAPDPKNSLYLTRVARVAVASAKENEEVSVAILEALGQLTRRGWGFGSPDPEIEADISGVTEALHAFYNQRAASEAVRFAIEKVLAGIDFQAYLKLNSDCGPILTLAKAIDLTHYAAPTVPSMLLGFEFDGIMPYVNGRPPAPPNITGAFVVLDPLDDGPSYELPSRCPATYSCCAGTDCVTLPAGFRPGIYRVHYRLVSGNTIISEGHGFRTAVPQPAVMALPRILPPSMSRRSIAWRQSWTTSLEALGAVAVLFLVARRFIRSRRRVAWFQSGRCHACGYDLRASGDRCPECGISVPAALPTQFLRRRLIGVAGAALMFTSGALVVIYARSFLVGDLLTHTHSFRADAAYTTRGVAVIQWLTTGSDVGWTYERAQPADLPRSAEDAGPPAERCLLGLEYSPSGKMVVVPLWIPVLILACTGFAMWRVRKPVLLSSPRGRRIIAK